MATERQNFAQDQADFMDLCGQERYSIGEVRHMLIARDKKFLAELIMHHGLCEEECAERAKHIEDFKNAPPGASEKGIDGFITDLVDDCIDELYVVCSFLNKIGIDAQSAWDEVHNSNMAKAVECHRCLGYGEYAPNHNEYETCNLCNGTGKIIKRRADGKILKPEGWQAPDLARIVEEHFSRSKGE